MSQPHEGLDLESPPGTPHWVKVFGIILIVLMLLVGIIIITGVGGPHGPGRHAPATEQGVQQP